jgi:hypothetical protein
MGALIVNIVTVSGLLLIFFGDYQDRLLSICNSEEVSSRRIGFSEI